MQIKTETKGKIVPQLLNRGHIHHDCIDLDLSKMLFLS